MTEPAQTSGEPLVEAERALVAALFEPAVCPDVLPRIKHDDILDAGLRHVVLLAQTLVEAGEPVTVGSVHAAAVARLPRIQQQAVVRAIVAAQASLATVPLWPSHLRVVLAAARRRRLAGLGARCAQVAEGPGQVHEVLTEIRAWCDEVDQDDSPRARGAAWLVEQALGRIDSPPEEPGIPSGLAELDRLTGGWRPGQVIVVAARPGVGKSTLLLDLGRHAARRHRVLLHTLEMSHAEVADRLLCAELGINLGRLRAGQLTDSEVAAAVDGQESVAMLDLVVDDSEGLSLASLRASARRVKPTLLLVDYLQLMTAPTASTREQAVAALSRGLKRLSRELGIPIVVAAQLNRQPEARADRRPALSDLRESGSVEQDADVVILLHRPELSDPDTPRAGEIELHVAKCRNGPTGTIEAVYQGWHSRIRPA